MNDNSNLDIEDKLNEQTVRIAQLEAHLNRLINVVNKLTQRVVTEESK